MNTSCAKRSCVFFLVLFWFQQIVSGAGVVTNCDETTLRAAMAGGGTVTFACDGILTLTNTLTVTNDTILDATGHFITLSGGGAIRVIVVQSGKLTLKRLAIADGYSSGGLGGGLLNLGDAAIIDCIFSNNIVANGPVFGGAINHEGTKLVVTGTTFIRNNAGVRGSAISCGNPVAGARNGNIALTNCTFYANGSEAIAIGQPLLNPVTIVNCTFASNTNAAVRQTTLGSYPGAAKVGLMNSIIAYTIGGEGAQGVVDLGNNLSSDNSASLTNGTSLKSTDPLLGLLTNNGGATPTMGLLYNSPAIDQGNDTTAPNTDQRGVLRPTRAKSDIGAFEGSVSPVNPSTVHFTSSNFSAGESQGSWLVQVERTGTSTGSVGVTVSATAGTASSGADFAATNVALVFAEGEMQKSVPVILFDNQTPETNETVLLNLSNPLGTVPDSPNAAQLTIIDDDQGYVLTNYNDASLRAAVSQGGWIQFPADGTITLTNPITISGFTILDASGHNVTFSGGNAVRLFNISAGAAVTFINLTIAEGRDQGSDGGPGTDGTAGSGGAIHIGNGTLNLLDCRLWTNTVAGGAGGNGNPNGSGGSASGGAIYLNGGTLNATNTAFVGNTTVGGPGGTNTSSPGAVGVGGKSWGGAIYSKSGLLNLDNCVFASNTATGGRAPEAASNAGVSGEASGGAWFNDGGTAVVARCSFTFNGSTTPQPYGPSGGSGGTARGGSICNATGAVSITQTKFEDSHVAGGNAVRYGLAGPGQGGAICNLDVLDLDECLFENNSANGGNNGVPAGNGAGGAIFNGGQLKIAQSEFIANKVQAGRGYFGGNGPIVSGIAQGGAIFSTNLLLLNKSTLSDNVAQGAAGGRSSFTPFPGYPAFGGAIYNAGACNLTNNTLTANVSSGGSYSEPPPPFNSSYTAGGDAYGGGLFHTNGTAFFVNNTISANVARGGAGYPDGQSYGGGIANTNGAITLLNTIVAHSLSGSNSFGTLTDAGHNLSSDTSCGFSATGSLKDTDPTLGPLGDYGGPTPTLPLLSGSPAIDGGDNAACPSTDQRGHARPYGTACDIGAFESSPPFVIRGRVSGFTLRDDVNITAGSATTMTTNRDSYSLEGLAASTYVVTPYHSNYLVIPNNRSVTTGPDQLNIDFKAYRWNAFSIEGVSNGVLHLAYADTNGQTHRVLASSNLTDWLPISTNTVGSNNLFHVFDTIDQRARFYRSQRP